MRSFFAKPKLILGIDSCSIHSTFDREKEGMFVSKGQLIYVINDRDLGGSLKERDRLPHA